SLVVGAGVIGSRVAGMLAERGDRVSVVSRHGAGPAELPGVTRVAADAADAEAMARLAEGAAVIYNCVNPPYHRWPADWPPIAASVLAAAERSGAVLVTLSNLYGYGPRVPGGYDDAHPITEATPLAATGRKGRVRARVWQDALAAHQAGRVRVAEVRAADFIGPGPPGSVRSAPARSPRPSCAEWGSSGRSCGSCARPSTSSATTSSWTLRPLRKPSASSRRHGRRSSPRPSVPLAGKEAVGTYLGEGLRDGALVTPVPDAGLELRARLDLEDAA